MTSLGRSFRVAGPSDDDLLALVRQVEARERELAALATVEDDADDGPSGDACPHCGEPALAFTECLVCGENGCLPRDDWQPGWGEPCLTRCSRCGILFHGDCGGVNEVGNPVCGTCGPALDVDDL